MGSSVKKGVGKPTLYKTAMKRKNVMLDLETIETLKALGGGNLSEGIRKAAEQSVHWTLPMCSVCGESVARKSGMCEDCEMLARQSQ